MTSDPGAKEAFVWCWLPGCEEPVVAGRVWSEGPLLNFNYGQSYLAREEAIPLYLPELPLRRGAIPPEPGLTIPGCIADAMPDAWGRRIVKQHLLGAVGAADELDPLTYLLNSGSDRFGALDFQESPDSYVAEDDGRAALEQLIEAAAYVDEGMALTPDLDRALLHGSSIGGARPKVLLDDGGRRLIAKFSSTSDGEFPFVKAEFAAMTLAQRAGLDVAAVDYRRVLGKDVLLVERFDRIPGTNQRLAAISALTLFGLPEESQPVDWSYAELAEIIRSRFREPRRTLRELFARITFNVIVGNTDDHPRNHAAFWDGSMLALTPAYDISPQRRSGGEAAQLMSISPEGWRMSQLAGCVAAASTYHLSAAEAREIIDNQVKVAESDWEDVCDEAEMNEIERRSLWRRQFLNPYALEGYAASGAAFDA